MVARLLVLFTGVSSWCHCWLVQQCFVYRINSYPQAWLGHPLWPLLAQADDEQSPLAKLPPEKRAKVVSAFIVLVILGAFMIAVAWLSARALRRYMRAPRRLPPSGAPGREDDWWKKPLVESPPLPDSKEPPGD